MNKDKIKKICRARGYTLKELSEMSGIPLSTLTKISSGETPDPRFETMEAIARVLRCSMDEFTEQEPMIGYKYEEYVYKFKQLSDHVKEYLKFIIDTEFDRMIYYKSENKIRLKCFEVTYILDGQGEYESMIEGEVQVNDNSLTRLCTFCVRLRTDTLKPKFFQGAVMGFQYEEHMEPKYGEIWIFLREGYLYVGRYFCRNGVRMLKSLNGTIEDIELTGKMNCKKMGRFVGLLNSEIIIDPGPQF